MLLYNIVSSSHIPVFSSLVCLFIIGEFEPLNGWKSCGLTKRNKCCYLIGLNWHAPRRQFIWVPGLVERAMDFSKGWHTELSSIPFFLVYNECTIQTWRQERKEERQTKQILVNLTNPVKSMSYFILKIKVKKRNYIGMKCDLDIFSFKWDSLI